MRDPLRSPISGFFCLLLLLTSFTTEAATSITSLDANPNPAAPGEVVTVTGTYETDALSSISYTVSYELKRDGSTIFLAEEQDFASAPFDGNLDPIAIPPELTSTPGTYDLIIRVSGVEDPGDPDGSSPFSDEASVSFVVEESVPMPVPPELDPVSLSLTGEPGEQVTGSFTISAGDGPFSLSASLGEVSPASAEVGQPLTYSYTIPSPAEPGSEIIDTVQAVSASGETATLPVTILVSAPPSGAVVVEPQSLSLEGRAGETVEQSFRVVAGIGPFELSATEGALSAATVGLNEAVTYSFSIPSDADAGTELGDVITVTAADGATTTLVATVAVSESDQPPSQTAIEEAMQSIAVTEPQKSTAAVISTVCPQGVAGEQLQEDCNTLVSASFTSKDEASRALAEVTADQASAPVDASQTSLQGQIRNIGTRIAALRGGITGFSARVLTLNIDGERLPVGQIAGDVIGALTGGAAGDGALDFGPWGFFLNGSVSSGDKDRTENAEGFDFDAWSVTLGADYRFQDNLIGGVALGYVKNQTDIDANGGDLDADGFNLSLYGTYYLENGLYLDGIVTYGWSDYDQTRRIRYDIGSVTVDQKADAGFDGSEWSASLGGGYTMARGPLSFGPTFRLEYLDTSIDGYEERMSSPDAPGGGWATRIEDQDVTSFTSQLGGEISYAVSTSWGVLLPNAHVEWVHEFEDGADNVVGHFVQDPTRTAFSLATDRPDKDYYNLRLGVSAQFAEGRSGYIYYRKLFGYSDLDAYTIAAGLRLEL